MRIERTSCGTRSPARSTGRAWGPATSPASTWTFRRTRPTRRPCGAQPTGRSSKWCSGERGPRPRDAGAARPRRPIASAQSYFFFAAFFVAFFAFFFAGIIDHLPSFPSPRSRRLSEQSALAPGKALGRPGACQPLLELSPRDPPDTTDPHRGYPRGVRVVHRAESAQDGRGVDAQACRDLVGRQILVIGPLACAACDGCAAGPWLLHLRKCILRALSSGRDRPRSGPVWLRFYTSLVREVTDA